MRGLEGVGVVVPAAGRGVRVGEEGPKAYIPLLGRPLIWHALCPFVSLKIPEIVVVIPPGTERTFEAAVGLSWPPVRIVSGRATRSESVRAGLEMLGPERELVLVHDGARPCVTEGLIRRVIRLLEGTEAAIPVLPLRETVKIVDGEEVVETPDRTRLRSVQTPQGFRAAVLRRAYEATSQSAPDDAALVEALGVSVRTCPGDPLNLKVTYPEDLLLAEVILKGREGAAGPGGLTGPRRVHRSSPANPAEGTPESPGPPSLG